MHLYIFKPSYCAVLGFCITSNLLLHKMEQWDSYEDGFSPLVQHKNLSVELLESGTSSMFWL